MHLRSSSTERTWAIALASLPLLLNTASVPDAALVGAAAAAEQPAPTPTQALPASGSAPVPIPVPDPGAVSGPASVSTPAFAEPDRRLVPTRTDVLVAGLPGERGRPPTVEVRAPKGRLVVSESGTGRLGIPSVAMVAYERAAGILGQVDPGCGIGWTLLAAVGRVESDHGRHGGATPGVDGVSRPLILGTALDGQGPVARIRDTDRGRWDGDPVWDRAVGPMQFIPSTWAIVGADGDADGIRSPHDIDDAALAAAVYLCAGTVGVSAPTVMAGALRRYNNSGAYVSLVMAYEQRYRDGGFEVTVSMADPPTLSSITLLPGPGAEVERTRPGQRGGRPQPPAPAEVETQGWPAGWGGHQVRPEEYDDRTAALATGAERGDGPGKDLRTGRPEHQPGRTEPSGKVDDGKAAPKARPEKARPEKAGKAEQRAPGEIDDGTTAEPELAAAEPTDDPAPAAPHEAADESGAEDDAPGPATPDGPATPAGAALDVVPAEPPVAGHSNPPADPPRGTPPVDPSAETPLMDPPADAAADPAGPPAVPPADPPAPVAVVRLTGLWQVCGTGWCLDDHQLGLGDGHRLEEPAPADLDGDGTVEGLGEELAGRAGTTVTVDVEQRPEGWFLVLGGED